MNSFPVLSLFFLSVCTAAPVSQPVFPGTQYITAQGLHPQYFQAAQAAIAAGASARPVYESAGAADRGGLQKYSTQIKQPIQQVLLANVDRQSHVQRVPTPVYVQQLQPQAYQATERKAAPQPITVPQTQYVTLNQQAEKYARPAAPGYQHPQVVQPQQYHRPQPQHHQQQQQRPREEEEDYDPNPSYQFGFDVNDDLYTNYQNRKEQREGNKITGSYSVVDSDGFIRTVTYTADPKEGFKAEVTRQPTDIVVKIPKPDPQFAKQPQQYIQAVPQQERAHAQSPKQNVIYQYQ